MIEEMTVTLSSVVTLIIVSVTWAGSIAGVYFGLRGRVAAGEVRMNGLSGRLAEGSEKFAGFDQRFKAIEDRQAHHAERIIVVETLLGSMNNKLDSILKAVNS